VGATWLEKQGRALEQVHDEALRNLEAQPVNFRVAEIPTPDGSAVQLGVIEGAGGGGALQAAPADHILNQNAMRAAQEKLGADPMVVAIPYREILFAAHPDLAINGPFINLACQAAPQRAEAITSIVFLIQDGLIVGKLNYG